MHAEAAMERRKARAAFVRDFPGRLESGEQSVGKCVVHVHAGPDGVSLVLFQDGTFLVTNPWAGSPDELQALLLEARPVLEPHQPAAYAQLDALRALEAEAMRLGRMEKVLGAVQNNLAQIPELRQALLDLLEEPEAGV